MDLMEGMRTCRCCKARRAAEDKLPRLLYPVILKNDREMWLCVYCDGDSFREAKELEARLISGEL